MLRFILPSILWTLFVIIISIVPGTDLNYGDFHFEGADKIAHVLLYTLFALFWSTALRRQNSNENLRIKAFKIIFIGGFALGLVLELIQENFIFGRYFELLDLVANGIGCIFGIILFKIIYRDIKRS